MNHNTNINSSDIAVIGMSCKFPGSDNIDSFWKNLSNGQESILHLEKNDLNSLGVSDILTRNPNYVGACGFLENIDKFDNSFFKINSLEAAAMDPQQRLLLEETHLALEDAGYSPDKYKGKIGIYAGSGPTQYYHELIRTGYFDKNSQSRQLLHYLGNEKDFLALRVAYALNLTGPAININLASATGLAVVVKACQSLANYEADIMIAGAVSIIMPSQFGYIYEPENIFSIDGHCRPFDAKSTGTVLGSGIGVVVLKRLCDAIHDNDSIYAVIKGYAINNDGNNKIGFTAPSIHGQASCLENALEMAKIDPCKLKFIEAHGTGTSLGDPIEIAALTQGIRKWNGEHQYCAIGSVKGNIGHAQSAAGMAGLIKLILSIKKAVIPPSLNFKSPNPKLNLSLSPFYVNSKSIAWNDFERTGSVNSLAMGGVNTHVIATNYSQPQQTENELKYRCNIIPLSANTNESLQDLKNKYITYLNSLSNEDLTDHNLFHSVAYTLQVGRKELTYREAWICDNLADFLEKLINKNQTNESFSTDIKHLQNTVDTWLSKGTVGWQKLYKKNPKRISLPTYPFEKFRHWIFEDNSNNKVSQIPKPINLQNVIKNEIIDIQSIIERLTTIWIKALHLNDIDHDDSFEEIGGDSLLAIDIISEIEKCLNVKLSIEDFLNNNTIALLSNYIVRHSQSTISKEKISILSHGTSGDYPVFIIHPGNGELYAYQNLANILGQKIKLIGIHNNVYNDTLEIESISINLLAERYIKLIKTIQASGPYTLCGWSFGGVVAFEMADQLTKQSESVAHIFLIDSWAKYADKFYDQNYFYNSYLRKDGRTSLKLNEVGTWGKLLWKRMEALFDYQPKIIDVPITLLKASTVNDEYIDVNTYDNHWQQYCKQIISIFLITGNHETILDLPGLENLASSFYKSLDKINMEKKL